MCENLSRLGPLRTKTNQNLKQDKQRKIKFDLLKKILATYLFLKIGTVNQKR